MNISSSIRGTLKIIKMEGVIEIDGSRFEGGGQILRLSLSLSVITQKRVRIFNIRSGRSNPGLSESHLVSVRILQNISDAQVSGDAKGSLCIDFQPNRPKSGNFNAICNTAGSTNLILQAALPVLISSRSSITIHGGTDVDFSLPSHYITSVLIPFLNRIQVSVEYTVEKYGFFPKGGGKIRVNTYPSTPRGLNILENHYSGYSCLFQHSFHTESNSPHRQKLQEIKSEVMRSLDIQESQISYSYTPGKDKSIVTSVWCDTDVVPMHYSFIENFRKSEYNVRRICEELKGEVERGNCVDQFLQDQMLVFLAMAEGSSRVAVREVSEHTKAAIEVINAFGIANVKFENGVIEIDPIREAKCI